jgi:hypothetical protein
MIFEIIYRAALFLSLIYTLDYALDGKLDLPHKYVEINYRRAWERILKFLRRLRRLNLVEIAYDKDDFHDEEVSKNE